ncbi:hypothetical protein D8Y22_19190 [Salinadaptatus halalkaliphilus]|uniref:Uncharacterized protein n=1 Tax=Salinadaptatus halalkaliphilus TaxID=2419781 RepID=A0A4S3TL16_9EURY|nr:hypothetical protein [Salinadaptatus halalkaliphilus]THE63288.1 hypothetical protein D8Y22_19190 [Salinadaptatus halalkaliphilus]
MTDNDTTDRMADISHTNPVTGERAGRLFERGPTVVADGGEEATTDAAGRTETTQTETMADIDHTPPQAADDANRVFERGRNYPVEEDE